MALTARRTRNTSQIPTFPDSAERRYRAYLNRRVRALDSLVRRFVLPVLEPGRVPRGDIKIPDKIKPKSDLERAPTVEEWIAMRNDGVPEALALLELLRRIFARQAAPDERFLAGLVQQVDNGVQRFTARLVAGVVAVPLPFDPRGFIAGNVTLIKSIDDRYLDDVAGLLYDALENGYSVRRAGVELSILTNTPLNRAKLIARDQLATVNAQITKQRQTRAGVRRYRWSTSLDERVRPEHAELEGRVFEWDSPPPDGHPGEPINCRCVAIPVFDDAE